jgi:hypothetical protein
MQAVSVAAVWIIVSHPARTRQTTKYITPRIQCFLDIGKRPLLLFVRLSHSPAIDISLPLGHAGQDAAQL